jgi:predicted permease
MKAAVTLRIFERGHRWLLRRLPEAGRPCAEDATDTLRDVCLAAHKRRGWWGLVAVGVLEWLDLAGYVVRARFGRGLPTTMAGSNAGRPAEKAGIMRKLWNDLRLGRRSLAANRGSAGISVATLALGIGLSTAVFSILDSMLWRPVPYREADRLVELAAFNTQRKFSFMGFYSPALIRAWRAETDLFDRIEGYDTPSLVYATDAGSEMVAAAVVTPGLMSMLGVPPQGGRTFGPGDGQTGTTNLAVVSDAFWRSALKKDPNAIGRELVFDGQRYQIIGIMPSAFRFPNGRVDVWVPYDVDHPPAGPQSARTLTPIARTAPGVSRTMASSEARARGSRVSASVGEDSRLTAEVYGIANYVDGKTRQSLWILAGAVGFLFLVVCTNVANLALARSILQGRHLAVRSALGASRGDLMRETLVESGLLAGAGCAAGIGLAVLLIRVALAVLPDSMMGSAMKPLSLDLEATAFAVTLGALAAILFGLPAAVVASGASVGQLLGASARGASASTLSRRLRSGLVIAEVSVSIVLLFGAALMTRSFVKLESVDKGFDSTNLISVRLGLPAQGYSDPAVRDRFMQDAVDRLRGTPGIVGATSGGLPTDARPIMLGAVEFGHRPGELTEPLFPLMHDVTGDYFTTLGVPILSGRTFRADDPPDAVIVSDAFARKYWPDGHALGGQFRKSNQSWQTVIGIVGNIRPMAADQSARGLDLYYRAGQAPKSMIASMPVSSIAEYRNLVVRADRPAQAIAILPQVIHAIDPRVVIWRTGLVDHLYADAIARPRTVLALMGTFAGVGLLLALAGIYGVLSYLVTQRVREIGIRLALGATPRDVGRLVMRSGLGLTGAGLVAGLILAAALTRVMRTLLYEVGPSDPLSMATVSAVLLGTAMLACWWPARRAMRIDPVQLLRQD